MQKETRQLESFLKNASLDDYDKYIAKENTNTYTDLADFLNTYLAKNNLVLSDIIKKSQLSRDYAYSIFNGNRKNPTRDRVIAICLAMGMDLDNTQRALKLCNAGTLYAKNNRDAAITICINRGITDIAAINDFLYDHELDILKTSKDS